MTASTPGARPLRIRSFAVALSIHARSRAARYDVRLPARRRFLRAVAEICWEHDVAWEWDLVGPLLRRRIEITFRGREVALLAVEGEIDIWLTAADDPWAA